MSHPVRRHAVMESDVSLVPAAAFAAVAMSFHQARNDDFVRETIIDFVRAPPSELIERSGAENPAVADRDMADFGPANVHGDDPAGGVDGEHGQGGSDGIGGAGDDRNAHAVAGGAMTGLVVDERRGLAAAALDRDRAA